jgi:hypothetical protein
MSEIILNVFNENNIIISQKIAFYFNYIKQEFTKTNKNVIILNKQSLDQDLINILTSQDKIIEKIVDFLNEYDKENNITNINNLNMQDIYNKFINNVILDDKFIIKTLKIANYLEVMPVILICGIRVNNLIKTASVDVLRDLFGEKDDLTKEEKLSIDLENKWGENI